jgi:hypothetical protein
MVGIRVASMQTAMAKKKGGALAVTGDAEAAPPIQFSFDEHCEFPVVKFR